MKLNLTELTLDVIANEVTRAVQEERERCIKALQAVVQDYIDTENYDCVSGEVTDRFMAKLTET